MVIVKLYALLLRYNTDGICTEDWKLFGLSVTKMKLWLLAEAPGYLIDLMHDKNPAIRKVCDACLDVIAVSKILQ